MTCPRCHGERDIAIVKNGNVSPTFPCPDCCPSVAAVGDKMREALEHLAALKDECKERLRTAQEVSPNDNVGIQVEAARLKVARKALAIATAALAHSRPVTAGAPAAWQYRCRPPGSDIWSNWRPCEDLRDVEDIAKHGKLAGYDAEARPLYAARPAADERIQSCRAHVAETALKEIRRYCDENLGPFRASLLNKIAATADAALALTEIPSASAARNSSEVVPAQTIEPEPDAGGTCSTCPDTLVCSTVGRCQAADDSTVTPQDGGPVTTEQLDVLQFGRPLHERPCGMFTDNSTPAEMAEFLRSCGSDTGDQIAKMLERLSTTATPPAPGAERAADYLKKLHRNLIGWLAARYVTSLEAAQTVASDCDKHIDKSGRLLGEVREAVYALPRADRAGGDT